MGFGPSSYLGVGVRKVLCGNRTRSYAQFPGLSLGGLSLRVDGRYGFFDGGDRFLFLEVNFSARVTDLGFDFAFRVPNLGANLVKFLCHVRANRSRLKL